MCKLFARVLLFSFFVSPVFAGVLSSAGERSSSDPNNVNGGEYFAVSQPAKKYGYFGLSVGGGLDYFKLDAKMYRDDVLKGSVNEDKTGRHYNVGIFAGYGFDFNNRYYLAGELSAFLNYLNETKSGTIADTIPAASFSKDPSSPCPAKPISDRTITHSVETGVKHPLIVAFDIMPGIFVDKNRELLFYGRLGVGGHWLRMHLKDRFNDDDGTVVDTKADRFRFGYRLGAGLEYFVNDSLGLRFEYVYQRINGKDDHKISDNEGQVVKIHDEVTLDCKYTATNPYKYIYGPGPMDIHTVNLSLAIYPSR